MMKKKNLLNAIALLLLTSTAAPLHSQGVKQIGSFRDYSIREGGSRSVNGVTMTEPDIYYFADGNNTFNAVRLTVVPVETPAAMTAPYLNEPTAHSIQVCWKSNDVVEGAVVRYGTAADQLTLQVTAEARQVASNYYWNTARLEGLEANAVYYYQVVAGERMSEVCRFRTQPEADSTEPFRILMVGDHQRNERSDYEWLLRMAKRTLDAKYGEAPLEDHIRLLMNVGDQVDSGSVRQYEFTHLYKSREVMSHVPIMTCVGNHELFKDPQLELYKRHYASYGNIDYQGITSGTALYYAYQAGPVLFVVMNTDGTSDVQKQWVQRVVAAADADASVRFIVSVQHRPMFAEQWAGDTNPWMTDEVMPILSASKKHVINCAGHHHLYARGQLTPWPVYHIITGGGVGTSAQDYEQLWGNTPDNRNRDEVQKTIDQWTYQIMEFDPVSATMTVETYSIGNRRLALDNVLIDRFSRCLSQPYIPTTPALDCASRFTRDGSAYVVPLPATIEQQTAVEGLHSSQYQIARDAQFSDIVFSRILLFEDFYDVDNKYLPKNVRDGQPVTTLELTASDLPSGTYFIRCRNRSMNLDWSEYSVPQTIRVTGSTAPSLSLSTTTLQPGGTLAVSYENAPVGKNAWVGIYKDNQHPGSSDPSYAWQYTSAASGTLQFTINDAGSYFAVLFCDDGYNEISPRYPFAVGADGMMRMENGTLDLGRMTSIFNLAGQRVAHSSILNHPLGPSGRFTLEESSIKRGIYIYNGKIIIMK